MRAVATIDDIAVFLPDRAVSVEDSVRGFGLNVPQVRMLRRLHGFAELRVDPELPLVDLVTAAARSALESVTDPARVRYLLYAHTVVNVAPSFVQLAEVLGQRLGLAHADSFAVSQQYCADSLSALDIAGELLRADGDPTARALLVTGEKRLATLVRPLALSTAIGEAAAACLIGLDGGGDRVLAYADRTVSLPDRSDWVSAETTEEFMARYPNDLAEVAGAALDTAGLTIGDIAMVVPHNVSRLLWYRTAEVLGVGRERIFLDTVARYGHCYCSDPFLNLVTLRGQGRLVAGGRYLLTSVGLGATHAAAVIEHRPVRGCQHD